jgi:hypothetical protein
VNGQLLTALRHGAAGHTATPCKPFFTDYLYLSFTNATSFAASDIVPLSSWAKTMMMLQSARSRSRRSRC